MGFVRPINAGRRPRGRPRWDGLGLSDPGVPALVPVPSHRGKSALSVVEGSRLAKKRGDPTVAVWLGSRDGQKSRPETTCGPAYPRHLLAMLVGNGAGGT
jgi:hypothetical protein